MTKALVRRQSEVIDAEFEDDPIVLRPKSRDDDHYPDPPPGCALIITDTQVLSVRATDLELLQERENFMVDGSSRVFQRPTNTRIRLDAIVMTHSLRSSR